MVHLYYLRVVYAFHSGPVRPHYNSGCRGIDRFGPDSIVHGTAIVVCLLRTLLFLACKGDR